MCCGKRGGMEINVKKGDIYEGMIDTFEYPDKGTLTAGEAKITVKHALPGQQVRVMITKKRGGRCEGRVLEVLEHSPLETAADPCPHYGECGGCVYQTIPYEKQLEIKEDQVRQLLDSVCDPALYRFDGMKASPVFEGYRNKMEFSFGDEYKDGPLALGLHRRGSRYDVIGTTDCRIAHPDFCRILKAVKVYFEELGIGFYRKLQHSGYLRHLLIRRAVKTGEILVVLVTTSQEEVELIPLVKQLLALPLEGTLTGILHTINDSLSDAVKNDRTELLYGQAYLSEELLGLKFKISPFSFFQTNSLGAEVLYETVREYVGDTKDRVVFDLYSGTGTIAQLVAPVARKVVGVEVVEEAVLAARENAKMNGIENCEFLVGDVLKVIGEIEEKPDLIILDPPREGVQPKALERLIAYGVERIVYVSCKPTSLVRDLAELQKHGYRVCRVCCVDMFPGTANCESIVLLSKHTAN